jgi:hypothetical protein
MCKWKCVLLCFDVKVMWNLVCVMSVDRELIFVARYSQFIYVHVETISVHCTNCVLLQGVYECVHACVYLWEREIERENRGFKYHVRGCRPNSATVVASTYFFIHTRENSTHPQSSEALNAGTSPTPDFSYSNRSSEPARHTIVFFSFVHDINIVTWRWPSTAKTCSHYRSYKYNTKTVVFLTDPYFLLLIYVNTTGMMYLK